MSRLLTLTIEVDLNEVSLSQEDVVSNVYKTLQSRKKVKLSSLFDLSKVEGYVTEIDNCVYPYKEGPYLRHDSHLEVKMTVPI